METHTQSETMQQLFLAQQQAFANCDYSDYQTRRYQLRALSQALVTYQYELVAAVNKDFGGRSSYETRYAELLPTLLAIKYTRRHLRQWMKPQRRKVEWLLQCALAKIQYEPRGVVGIVVPWNYPLFLALSPLIGAIAAGNHVMIKVSELSTYTGEVLQRLLSDVFSTTQVAVVQGDTDVAKAFTRLPFNHILFTGSTQVGKHVMREAANHLTSVTLELGGKSPLVIDASANLDKIAEQICLAKVFNAGQTCIAPDYILCPEQMCAHLIEALIAAFNRLYPNYFTNHDYTALINEHHSQRLQDLIADAESQGAICHQVEISSTAHQLRCLPLTILHPVTQTMRVMQEEIFGPVLPIVTYQYPNEVLPYLACHAVPLVIYYFGGDTPLRQQLLNRAQAGAVSINDCLTHIAVADLPFGGFGDSGIGRYHAFEGFVSFSQVKAIFVRQRLNFSRFIFPPYGGFIQRLLLKLHRLL